MRPNEERRLVVKIADALWEVGADEARVKEWIELLNSNRLKVGVGLLRDAEDAYDPMGALAKQNLVDWTWDEDEGAWAIAGEVMFAPPKLVKDWLAARGSVAAVQRLSEIMAETSDGSTEMKQVGGLLDAAWERMTSMKREFDDRAAAAQDHERGRYVHVGDVRRAMAAKVRTTQHLIPPAVREQMMMARQAAESRYRYKPDYVERPLSGAQADYVIIDDVDPDDPFGEDDL